MPHCDLALHEHLFRHNFKLDQLRGISLMLANNLEVYSERFVWLGTFSVLEKDSVS